ncbi:MULTISPECIES: hypothetical protein [unclassified Achromobacter]|uniref:hypothetical protein n=1 Tax=unclassified Achromobacter TaxID=2626865 RepID=UPI000B5172A1|nr:MULTISPECIES: hypothetical protein [unclassified Achromobacter]OWT70217.1 hypothetical protein CEY05_26595 [Achromobacter sp. HZ34]OWT71757.1 hypothetical protein CEY04_25430 [Achromobacter sp. HZ28]
MIRWHHVARGVIRGRAFAIEIASVEAGFVARALVDGMPPMGDSSVSHSEQVAVGKAMSLAYAYAHGLASRGSGAGLGEAGAEGQRRAA